MYASDQAVSGKPLLHASLCLRGLAAGDGKTSHIYLTTLTNVSAGKGVCLAPGFLNDHSGQFAWIPFDCKKKRNRSPDSS